MVPIGNSGTSGSSPDQNRERIDDNLNIFKRGRKWYAQIQMDRRQIRQSLKTSNKDVARKRAIQIAAKLAQGTFQVVKKALLIVEAVAAYLKVLAADNRAANTIKRYEGILYRFISFADGQKAFRLDRVDLLLMDSYRAHRKGKGASSKTIHIECTVIRQLVNFAMRRKLLHSDPLCGFKNRKPTPTEQPNFSIEEVETILANAHERWKPAFEFLAFTGMRINELVNLEWSDVDLKKGLINIRIKPFWKPKDGDARMFPIHSRVRAVLDSLPRTSRWVFTGVPCKKFPKGGQQVFDRRALSALKTALKRAGIAEGKVHTFRHFFITYCINKGVSPFMIAEWVGHSSLAMVMRYYRASAKESRRIMDGLADGDEEEAK